MTFLERASELLDAKLDVASERLNSIVQAAILPSVAMRCNICEKRPVVSGRKVDNGESNRENTLLRVKVAMFSKILQRFMARSPVSVMVYKSCA
jgi:hypothetical protein